MRVRAKAYEVERARGMDFEEAAEVFVDAFFVRDGSARADKKEISSLRRAQTSDLQKRYSNAKKGAMFIIRDEQSCDVVACAGVEYRRYLDDYDYDNVPEDVDRFGLGSSYIRPIIGNLGVASSARGKGYAKALVRECEKEAKKNGFEECALIVESTNGKARSLYKKSGYKVIKALSDQNALKMASDGIARITKVKTMLMRKSLTNESENIDPLTIVVPLIGIGLAYTAIMNDDLRGFVEEMWHN